MLGFLQGIMHISFNSFNSFPAGFFNLQNLHLLFSFFFLLPSFFFCQVELDPSRFFPHIRGQCKNLP